MKKIISFVLVVCLLAGMLTMGASAAGLSFTDVTPDNWFYSTVMAAAEAGLTAGNSATTYGPDKELTWIQTVVFAVRLTQYVQGQHVYGAEDQTEVWYDIYLDYANEYVLIDYIPEDINHFTSRGEAAEIFSRVMWYGYYEQINYLPDDHFSDVSYYESPAIYELAGAGIVDGMGGGVFGADVLLNRAQVATIVARMAGLVDKVVIELKPEVVHSDLYIEGLDVETVIDYFAEVCLDTEYGDKANSIYVRKWLEPIGYRVFGSYTDSDMAVLEDFVAQINGIYGFPGMYETNSEYDIDLEIYFCDEAGFLEIAGYDMAGNWGNVSFWFWLENYEIYDETIAIRSDIPQYARESIIREEIYNGLGPVQDTECRYDSLIYQWSNDVQGMSPEDVLILRLLYHPSMRSGMNYDECAAVIRELYY